MSSDPDFGFAPLYTPVDRLANTPLKHMVFIRGLITAWLHDTEPGQQLTASQGWEEAYFGVLELLDTGAMVMTRTAHHPSHADFRMGLKLTEAGHVLGRSVTP